MAALGVFYAGWQGLRKILRVADVILGYEDAQGHHPGLGERVGTLEDEVAELKRMVAIALAAQGVEPEDIP
jgi:hypothetical protein